MRARTESLGILRTPMTWGWQSAWAPRAVSDARAGVFCRVACAQSVCAGKNGIAAREAKTATAGAMRERLKRVRTDVSLMPRKLPLTRFTVKIRTPSLLSELHPNWLPRGKYDYMGAMGPGASGDGSSEHFQAMLLDYHQQLQSHATRLFRAGLPLFYRGLAGVQVAGKYRLADPLAFAKLFDLMGLDRSGNRQARFIKAAHGGFVDGAHFEHGRGRGMNCLIGAAFEL